MYVVHWWRCDRNGEGVDKWVKQIGGRGGIGVDTSTSRSQGGPETVR